MKQTINEYQFADAFKKSDTYKNNFSYAGLRALFNYFEEYEEGTGEEIDFDMVAICCEYAEYASALECAVSYGYAMDGLSEEDEEAQALSWLEDHTQVITFDDNTVDGRGVIIMQF